MLCSSIYNQSGFDCNWNELLLKKTGKETKSGKSLFKLTED